MNIRFAVYFCLFFPRTKNFSMLSHWLIIDFFFLPLLPLPTFYALNPCTRKYTGDNSLPPTSYRLFQKYSLKCMTFFLFISPHVFLLLEKVDIKCQIQQLQLWVNAPPPLIYLFSVLDCIHRLRRLVSFHGFLLFYFCF